MNVCAEFLRISRLAPVEVPPALVSITIGLFVPPELTLEQTRNRYGRVPAAKFSVIWRIEPAFELFRTHGNVPGKVVALYIIGVASPVMTLLFQTSVQLVTSDPDRTMPDALDHHATRKPEPAE
jgi:hypothetical protein